jgi:hypothetical protein
MTIIQTGFVHFSSRALLFSLQENEVPTEEDGEEAEGRSLELENGGAEDGDGADSDASGHGGKRVEIPGLRRICKAGE